MNWPRPIDEIIDIGWPVILLIEVGLLLVALSLEFQFEENSSGALLVCVALICEVYLSNTSWKSTGDIVGFNFLTRGKYEQPGQYNFDAYKIVDLGNPKFDFGYIHYNATEELDRLRDRAHANDFYGGDKNYWNFRQTSRRISRTLSVLIVITAIAGTMLWGYGHYIT